MLVVSTLWLVLKRENQRRQAAVAADVALEGEGQILADDDVRWIFQT